VIRIRSRLETGRLDAYIKKLDPMEAEIAKASAERIRASAQANAPVDTGSLRTGIAVQTHTSSDYSAVASAAKGQNPEAVILPAPPLPSRKGAAEAVVVVEHGKYVNYGTINMAPRPFFDRAVAEERPRLVDEAKRAIQP